MKKTLCTILIAILLVACNDDILTSSSSNSLNTVSSNADTSLNSNSDGDSNSFETSSSESSKDSSYGSTVIGGSSGNSTGNNSSGNNNQTTNQQTSATTNVNRPVTNPDGSTTLPIAASFTNSIDITEYTNFDFKSSMPTNFKYIYGNNIVNPEFYADAVGGLKINENSGPKKGFQTAVFNPWLKIELKINIGSFYNASHKVVTSTNVFTIYGFDANGLIVATEYVDNIESTSQKGFVRVYLRNINIRYIEVRATNLPYKSSQVYNFGITGITLKGWPYN